MTMGFTKSNSSEITLILAIWIKEQFGDMSMQDVAIAFDLVTAKKIGADIRHYNSFSKQYIGEVLNAFKDFRNKQMKLFKESEASKQLEEPKPQVTNQEMYEGIKRIALETGKIMKVADWTGAYNYAWKEKLIYRMNDQERKEYKLKLEKAIKTEKSAGIYIGDYSIQSECHKRIMKAHFQEMINKEV